jgi:protoporphyrinogen oxidase
MHQKEYECCILGAGPAGLGTAMELVKHGVRDCVLIDRNHTVGGLSRTEVFDGIRFDVGPHRFFTKNREINQLWHDTLGEEFIPVERLTRIFYNKKLFNYPLKAGDALTKMGITESMHAMFSFALAKFYRSRDAVSFEDWIVAKFGRKIYETFFKTYTEKVWGIPCNQIGAEWAAQRIKGLDLFQVMKNALRLNQRGNIKTLVDQFDYPLLGAGYMYEAMADKVAAKGVHVLTDTTIHQFQRNDREITAIEARDSDGNSFLIKAGHYFNSIPITTFFRMLSPLEDEPVQKAADSLYFRDHITVNLLVDSTDVFPDQWIYVHAPDVLMARVANYRNFSAKMVPAGKSALSVEYFVFKGDQVWNKSDEELIRLAVEEMHRSTLIRNDQVEKGWVVRETESYPTYYIGFHKPYSVLKEVLNQYKNLTPIGRGGLYKYNNQDHSIYSGLLAARNYAKSEPVRYNLWDINIDAEYQESLERQELNEFSKH